MLRSFAGLAPWLPRCPRTPPTAHLLRPRPSTAVAPLTRPLFLHTARPLRCSSPADMASEMPERPKKAEKKDKKAAKGGAASGPLELDPPPPYFQHRIDLFEKLKKEQVDHAAAQPRNPISITLPDGKIHSGTSWETTPGAIARGLSKSLYERTVISKVNGELWDLERPLEADCALELLDFDTEDGKKVFWHSSAHILGEAAERKYGCDLCIGPPVDDGFYYEMALPDGAAVMQEDWASLTTIAEKAIKEKQPFERLTVTKDQLLEMFKSNKYKQHIIKDKIADGTSTTVYRCGPLIDLCRGPHVPHTGRIKTFQIMKNSASYFLGDANNDSLQRIYGVSFPDKERMKEHMKYLEEAAKRDHRRIGKDQELFFFHEQSPGSCFFLPHGTIIYNALQSSLREEYWKRGYQEVITPNMFSSELWKRSGHWQHYKDDMFTFDMESDKWGLKPMNCPGHCLLFGHRTRSYQELPMRVADFGVLHRNEASGALTGLTRVRRFQQDDAHIFCTEEQIGDEILGLFDFLKGAYGKFGFTFRMKLSTRPDNFLGEIPTWDRAEERLRNALDHFAAESGVKWELNPGDGAFYGPKIDVTISDALKREFQCATLQLDFQLPQQFNLEFVTAKTAADGSGAAAAAATAPPATGGAAQNGDSQPAKPQQSAVAAAADAASSVISSVAQAAEKAVATPGDAAAKAPAGAAPPVAPEKYRTQLTPGCARPVMIHRAIYGSFERFIAILTEHFAGKWPLWLSPRQVLVVPVMPAANGYVHEVVGALRARGFHADEDVTGNTMQKKIRTGQLQQYNFIWVVGAQEQESRTVNIRDRDDQSTQQRGEIVPLDQAVVKLEALRESKHFVLPTLGS